MSRSMHTSIRGIAQYVQLPIASPFWCFEHIDQPKVVVYDQTNESSCTRWLNAMTTNLCQRSWGEIAYFFICLTY